MRTFSFLVAILLGILSRAEAQAPPPMPKVELAASAGLITMTPGQNHRSYSDHWYGDGRYAGSIAYYWTRNLKTEFEHQWSGEGARYEQDFVAIDGAIHPFGREMFYQLQQSSLKVVWQFGNNLWVHPYLSAGAVLDIERRHSFSPPVYQPGVRGTVIIRPPTETRHRTEHRGGWIVGGGAKFYVSPRAFVNAGVVGTKSRPGASLSVLTGFGIEF